jgi:hypothetical protein
MLILSNPARNGKNWGVCRNPTKSISKQKKK